MRGIKKLKLVESQLNKIIKIQLSRTYPESLILFRFDTSPQK
jgi:hypothetical protein